MASEDCPDQAGRGTGNREEVGTYILVHNERRGGVWQTDRLGAAAQAARESSRAERSGAERGWSRSHPAKTALKGGAGGRGGYSRTRCCHGYRDPMADCCFPIASRLLVCLCVSLELYSLPSIQRPLTSQPFPLAWHWGSRTGSSQLVEAGSQSASRQA